MRRVTTCVAGPTFSKSRQTRQDPPKYSRQFASSKYGYPTGDHPYEIRHGILGIPWCLRGHGAPGRACSTHFVSDVLRLLRLLDLRYCRPRFGRMTKQQCKMFLFSSPEVPYRPIALMCTPAPFMGRGWSGEIGPGRASSMGWAFSHWQNPNTASGSGQP